MRKPDGRLERLTMRSECQPDNAARPLTMTVERSMRANAADIYRAWTQDFDAWFAQPGELFMTPEVDRPSSASNSRHRTAARCFASRTQASRTKHRATVTKRTGPKPWPLWTTRCTPTRDGHVESSRRPSSSRPSSRQIRDRSKSRIQSLNARYTGTSARASRAKTSAPRSS